MMIYTATVVSVLAGVCTVDVYFRAAVFGFFLCGQLERVVGSQLLDARCQARHCLMRVSIVAPRWFTVVSSFSHVLFGIEKELEVALGMGNLLSGV